jgi:hypothetical protein
MKEKQVFLLHFPRFFVTLRQSREVTTLGIKNKYIYFVLLSFFRNFARILSFSLYKGGLGD